MPKFSLNKHERLKSNKLITQLFVEGRKVRQGPLLLLWRTIPYNASVPVAFGVSVSKRKFKRAVDRNLMKRRIREAYRHCKPDLLETPTLRHTSYAFFVVFVGHDLQDYQSIQLAMNRLLDKWKTQQN